MSPTSSVLMQQTRTSELLKPGRGAKFFLPVGDRGRGDCPDLGLGAASPDCGLGEAWPGAGGQLRGLSKVSSLQACFRGFIQQYFLHVCGVPSTLPGTRDASQNKTVKKVPVAFWWGKQA